MADMRQLLESLRRIVRGRIATRHRARFDTSDIVQECAVQLINEFKPNSESSGKSRLISQAWLSRIGMGNLARLLKRELARCRSVSREEVVQSELQGKNETPEDAVEKRELTSRLVLALSILNELEAEVIHRHYRLQQSLNSIAVEIGLSSKQVQRIHRAILSKLKLELIEESSVPSQESSHE